MKKFLFLIALFTLMGGVNSYATRVYASYGTPAANGSWDSGTKTYSWTGNSNNLMRIFTFSSGELRNFNSIHFTTSDLSDGGIYRLYFHGPNKEIAFYSHGEKNIVFADRDELKGVDLATVTSISFGGASGSGSIKITATPYIEKPTEFTFNDAGKAYLYPSDLTASTWGLDSYDAETGIVTKNTEGYGNISFSFGDAGYDFSNITNIEINIDGGYDDIRDYSYVKDLNNHTQYISATGGAYSLGGEIDSNIKEWSLGLNSKTGSMKINYICFTSNVLNACLGEESLMTDLTAYHWDGSAWQTSGHTPSYRVNESTSVAYYGVDWNGEQCQNYSDVEGYKAIRIYSAQGNIPRAMFFNSDASNQQQFNFTWNAEGGYYELLLSTVYASVGNYKLISVRPQSSTTSSIKGIYIIENSPIYDYKISGNGLVTSKVTEALADATATSYDATGVTGTGVDFTSVANPNALFKANAGVLANTKNVITSGTCAKLVLTDGYPFKAPADFTATAASYSTTINAEAGAGTLCLPFAAAIPGGVTAYTLTYTSGDKATATPVETTILANTPVLLNGSGAAEFTGSGTVDADATNENGALTGVFASASVPTNSYVLQNQGGNVSFYRVDSGDPITIPPFRAYLTSQGAGARSISISYGAVTSVNEVKAKKAGEKDVYYNLNGQRVSNPTKGIFIVNGVKVSF